MEVIFATTTTEGCRAYGGGRTAPFPGDHAGPGIPVQCTSSSVPVATTAPAKPTPADSGGLPFTGGDVVGLGLIGTLLVAAGMAFVRRGRRVTA